MHIREIIASAASSKPKTHFQFYGANHLYLMTIALIREKTKKKKTPLQDMTHPSIAKKTYKTKTAKLVPVFAARWRSKRNISTAQKTN
jgi:hypothetical protein